MNQNNPNHNEGVDLNGASKDSDTGTGVKFNEYRVARDYPAQTSKMAHWVIKYSGGLITSQKEAEYVLLAFTAVAVIISLFLVLGGKHQTKIIPQFREDIAPEVRAKLPPGVFETIPSKYDQ